MHAIAGHAWPAMAGHAMAMHGRPWPWPWLAMAVLGCMALPVRQWPVMASYGQPRPTMAGHGQRGNFKPPGLCCHLYAALRRSSSLPTVGMHLCMPEWLKSQKRYGGNRGGRRLRHRLRRSRRCCCVVVVVACSGPPASMEGHQHAVVVGASITPILIGGRGHIKAHTMCG